MNQLLDFLLPTRWRRRPAPNQEANAATLARLDDLDPVYRLLMDHAHVRAQNALRELMHPKCTDSGLHYWRGQLAGLAEHIEEIEQLRLRWREQKQAQQVERKQGVL